MCGVCVSSPHCHQRAGLARSRPPPRCSPGRMEGGGDRRPGCRVRLEHRLSGAAGVTMKPVGLGTMRRDPYARGAAGRLFLGGSERLKAFKRRGPPQILTEFLQRCLAACTPAKPPSELPTVAAEGPLGSPFLCPELHLHMSGRPGGPRELNRLSLEWSRSALHGPLMPRGLLTEGSSGAREASGRRH